MSAAPATRAELRLLERLQRGRERRETGLCLAEGATLLGEALAAGLAPNLVAAEAAQLREHGELLDRAAAAGARLVEVEPRYGARLADREHGPLLVAAVPRPAPWDGTLPEAGAAMLLVLWGTQDPGNVGALLRSGLAFGARACLLAPGSADPSGPKVVRASAGAAFRLPCAPLEDVAALQSLAAALRLRPTRAVPQAGTCPEGGEALPERCLLVLGPETRSPPELPGALALSVAHSPAVESLNVAVAGSILLGRWYAAHGR